MSDIVRKLRDVDAPICDEAADEIERLRIQRDVARNELHEPMAAVERLVRERDALRDALRDTSYFRNRDGEMLTIEYSRWLEKHKAAIDAARSGK